MGKKSRRNKPKSSGAHGTDGSRRQPQRCAPPTPRVVAHQNFRELPPQACIDLIKEGHVGVIREVASLVDTHPADVEYGRKLLEAGLIDALVEMLAKGHEEGSHELAAMALPSKWMSVIASVIPPPACGKIFERLSPVFRCLMNSQDRTFFNSNLEWYLCQFWFFRFVEGAVKCRNYDVIPLLLKCDGLIEFVVRALFWKSKRPDIAREVRARFDSYVGEADEYYSNLWDGAVDALSAIVTGCLIVVEEKNAQCFIPGFGEEAVHRIAHSSVVASEYDCTNDEVFVASMFDILPAVSREKKSMLWEIQDIFSQSERVDKRVIIQCMKYSRSVALDFGEMKRVAGYLKLTFSPLSSVQAVDASGEIKEHMGRYPRDSRYAVAIGSGLFELCVDLLLRFGMHEDMFRIVRDIIEGATKLAFVPKTAKSIAEQRQSLQHFIESRMHAIDELDDKCLACIDAIERMATWAKSSDESFCQRMMAGTHCMNCRKQLKKKEAMKCSGCKVASYCGKQCQKADWRYHKGQCEGLAETAGLGVKVSSIQAGQLRSAGLRTAMDYLLNILLQAEIQGVSIVDDCIVFVDLCGIQPQVKVMVDDDFFAMIKSRDGRDIVNGRESLKKTRAAYSGCIACVFEALTKNARMYLAMDVIPTAWAHSKSWTLGQTLLSTDPACVEILSCCERDSEYKKNKLEELETTVHRARA